MFHVFRKLYRDVEKTYTELLEMVSTLSGMTNTVHEINSRKGMRKGKVSELQIIAIETSQNSKGIKATLAFFAVPSSYQTCSCFSTFALVMTSAYNYSP